jgi:uncharacterized UPF0160 family protein
MKNIMTIKSIATHNGNFHADDVFAVAALKNIFTDINLIRTRDLEVIAKADIVVDVGNEYDSATDRFDHHQRGGAGERKNGIPYSSFGLVWEKYGLQICHGDQQVMTMVDIELVSVIDAIDCGYTEGGEGVSLSQTIAMFNPAWQEDDSFDDCFDEALSFASRILSRFIADAKGDISARTLVETAIDSADDPRVIVLEKYSPWKTTVHELSKTALYVVYPSLSDKWMLHTVAIEPGSFEDRKPLPKQWAGLSDKALQDVTAIDDAMFCHNGLFIAGAQSYQSIMKMAAIALNE